MRFLADMGISPKTVAMLRDLGHDAVHLHEQGLNTLQDEDILAKALRERRNLLTHDLDFAELVATGGTELPGVVVFRLRNMSPINVDNYLRAVIDRHGQVLEQGAIISVTEGRTRVRPFPIEGDNKN